MPGASCTDDDDCNSPIYQSAGDSASATGTCYVRSEDYENLISEESFCLMEDAYTACASTDDDDVCSGSSVDPSTCADQCSSNYQCEVGYCSSTYGICS